MPLNSATAARSDGGALVELPLKLKWRCWTDGYKQAKTKATETRRSTRNAQNNPYTQAQGKIGEMVFALTFGLDYEHCFTETVRTRDWDFKTPRGTIDLKSCELTDRCLVWPVGKNSEFWTKEFDLLGLVKVDTLEGRGRFVGWVAKQRFWDTKKIAQPGHFLDPNTWHLLDDELEPPELVMEELGHRCVCREWACYGIRRRDREGYDWYCRDHVELADPNFFAYARRTEARRPDGDLVASNHK